MTRSLIPAVLAAATVLGTGVPAFAQGGGGLSGEEKRREFTRLFRQGLHAITNRQLDRSERLFKACVQLYPERPTAYYNLACTYSLAEETEPAVKMLREAFERGFNDLAHVARDGDLDNIRKTPEFRAALGELEEAAQDGVPEPLHRVPEESDAPHPLVVLVPNDGADAEATLGHLGEALPADEWGIFVPRAPGGADGGHGEWDDRAEWLVTRAVREFVGEHEQVDRDRVFLLARERSAMRAVSFLAHNPDLFTGVAADGPWVGLDVGDLDLSGVRGYLAVPADDEGSRRSGILARDAFAEDGSPVVLERAPEGALFRDRDLLHRALAFLSGEDVELPGEGESVSF